MDQKRTFCSDQKRTFFSLGRSQLWVFSVCVIVSVGEFVSKQVFLLDPTICDPRPFVIQLIKGPFLSAPQLCGSRGVRTKVRHLGFAWPRSCAAPLLRGPAGLGSSAPQLCGSWIRVNFQCCCFFPSDDIAPRLRVPPPGAQNANPYNVFGPRGRNLAIPTTFSGPWGGIFVIPAGEGAPGPRK